MMKKIVFLALFGFCLCAPLCAETIVLKSGTTVEATIVERTSEYVKVEVEGVSLTYFLEEIESIDGAAVAVPVREEPVEAGEPEASVTSGPHAITIDGDAGDWDGVPFLIKDPAGDVSSRDGHRQFDVTGVKLVRDDSFLYVGLAFAEEVDTVLKANREISSKIAKIYFDADNDRQTGGKVWPTKTGGFEGILEVSSGVGDEKKKMSVWAGSGMMDIPEDAVLKYFFVYCPGVHDAKEDSLKSDFFKMVRSDEEPESVAFGGAFIEMKVALSALGLDGGPEAVRVLFSEEGTGSPHSFVGTQGAQELGEDFSDEVLWKP